MITSVGFEQLFEQLVEAASTEAERRVMKKISSILPPENDRTLDAKEAATYLGFSTQLLYLKCREGEIPHWPGGKRGSQKPRLLFSLVSLAEWKRKQEKCDS